MTVPTQTDPQQREGEPAEPAAAPCDSTLPPSTEHGRSDVTLPPPAAGLATTLPPDKQSPASQSAETMAPSAGEDRPAFFESPTGIATGASFGEYQVIETIAKGGMGIVFKARQRKLNRIVAIKMILAGQLADKTDVDRFYTEAEAAAALSHPNIVKIYEIGQVQGQHFFSMEYIEGHSLAELIRESPLTPRRAAEFLQTIAATMHFAHERGVVHRDLKPANVLVDRQQRPMITDFGLAKQVANQSQITVAGAVMGTPSYMPPEQAAGRGDDIGPVSDIYSLGAILYELVTGHPPFRAASPFETIRQVLQDEPLSPRLANPGVPRDLETICLKCLQKEQSRRYATGQELADELGRFLRGEPINARPIGQLARLWRICRRYPVAASAIVLAVLLLASTAVVATTAYVTTSQALAQSEQSLREAIGAVNDLFTRVSEDTLLNQPGMQPLRKDLLALALSYYQRFLEQRANDPRVQDELADAYFRVGLITEVLESPEQALPSYETARRMQVSYLARRPDDPARLKALGNTLNALGNVQVKQKKYDAARQEYREAVRVRSRLAQTDAASSEYQRVLANTYMNFGLAEFNAGNIPAARMQFGEAQKIRQQALAQDRDNAKLLRDLGKGSYNLGNVELADDNAAAAEKHFAGAAQTFERLVAREPDELENQKLLAICHRLLGDVQGADRLDEARRHYRQALDRLTPLAQQNPEVVDYQTERAGIYMNLASIEFEAGNSAGVLAALEQARDILQPLAERLPLIPRYQSDLAVTLRELAVTQHAAGDVQSAQENLSQARQILTRLVQQFPAEPEYKRLLEESNAVELAPK